MPGIPEYGVHPWTVFVVSVRRIDRFRNAFHLADDRRIRFGVASSLVSVRNSRVKGRSTHIPKSRELKAPWNHYQTISQSVVSANAANLACESSTNTPGILILLQHRTVHPTAANWRLGCALTLDIASKLVRL